MTTDDIGWITTAPWCERCHIQLSRKHSDYSTHKIT